MTFEELYRRNYKSIFRFCFRILDSHELALDVVQDTFLKLYEQMNKSEYLIENPRAWLYKVAGNMSLNVIDKTNRRNEINKELDFISQENSNPESQFITKENKHRVKNAILSLEPTNQMLVLMYQDGLTYKEMSDVSGIPLNSVGKTLWRCIEKISQNIKRTDDE